MGSMHTGLEESKGGFDKMAAFYGERARHGVGLIVTGGVSPNYRGWLSPFAITLKKKSQVAKHRKITESVHCEGGKICMQILHAGRYGYHPLCVAPSRIKSPISPFKPWSLSKRGIKSTIRDFARTAELAKLAGYDGVEIMGSEGYLINQFIAPRTNKRKDEWGGSFKNRVRFPLEIVKAIREKLGKNFIVIFRLSMLDLVDEGSTWEEVVQLAKLLQKEGVDIINTGIGWHEARVPTIATMVPRKAFTWISERIKKELQIPVITTNRINTPDVAEEILAKGEADMISMARPFLADPEFMSKAEAGKAEEINTCIACNQACLDHIFQRKVASCLVNPRACRETEYDAGHSDSKQNVLIIGGGPAGMSCALESARLGHSVTLCEASDSLGGQFKLAQEIPGKGEFKETMRYYRSMLKKHGVKIHLNHRVDEDYIKNSSFDQVVFSSGVKPRKLRLEGAEGENVIAYDELLSGRKKTGQRVAIIGAGGIGFDVATYLTAGKEEEDLDAFLNYWGVDRSFRDRGALNDKSANYPSDKKIWLFQRKEGKHGANLGKTTGWIHRSHLKKKGVNMIGGVSYKSITADGLLFIKNDKEELLEVDSIVICAGQVSVNELYHQLEEEGLPVHLIGGARLAAEIDAQRAIREGFELARSF